MWQKYLYFEQKLSFFFRRHSTRLLSYSIGVIYLWFGVLKMLGISPVEELVLRATPWDDVHNFVIILGVWEIIIGLCFFFRKLRRLGIWLYFLHFPGIWLPLFTNPEDAFTLIPYGLTLEGQYIIKNLVLLAVVLVLIGSLHTPEKNEF